VTLLLTYTAFDIGRTLFGYVTNTVTVEAKGVLAILRQMIRRVAKTVCLKLSLIENPKKEFAKTLERRNVRVNIHSNVTTAITDRRMTLDSAPPLRINPAIPLKAIFESTVTQ